MRRPSLHRPHRVLLVGPHPPPFGGPGVHMVHLRRRLEAEGAICAILNLGPGRREPRDGVIPVHSGMDFVAKVARHAWNGYAVHHFFNVEASKAILLAIAAAVTTRSFGGAYSIGFIGGPRQRYLDRRHSVWSRLFRVPLGLARFVICNNRGVRDVLLRRGADEHQVVAIECFHEDQVAEVGALAPDVSRFTEQHDPVLSTVVHPRYETPDPHHELKIVLPALGLLRRRYPHAGCVVVGGHTSRDLYESMTRQANLEAHVLFAGEVDHADCLAVMRASDLFVRAYVKDGSSSSVREALALGVPTVASRNAQHPVEVSAFEPLDPRSLAEVLEDVLRNAGAKRRAVADGGTRMGGMEQEVALFLADGGGPGVSHDRMRVAAGGAGGRSTAGERQWP